MSESGVRMHESEFRWIGLPRVSTVGQAEDGNGLETQTAAIERFVDQRGDRLVKILAETGVSGVSAKLAHRIALGEALHMLNRNEADGIVVDRLDRLGRDIYVQEKILHDVRALGCVVASCNPTEQDALDNDTDPIRKMTRQILAVVADYERAMIIARTQAGRRRALANGGWAGGMTPYGYESDGNGRLREVAHEMDAISQARTMRRVGASYQTICEYLTVAGVRLRKGTKFHVEVIKRIIAKAESDDYPKGSPLNNLAKIVMGLPTDADAI
jgi:DNA invertase Pin-like site-specific DNA recombinase